MTFKKILKWIFGWIKGENALMLTGVFSTLLWFVIDWCLSTTFRPMSIPLLYLVNFFAALVLLAPWMLTRSRTVGIVVLVIMILFSEANLIYCRTYFTAIPPDGYLLAGNMMDFTNSIWFNLRWSDLGFLCILLVIAVYRVKSACLNKRYALKSYSATTCIFGLISYIYILCLGGFYNAYNSLVQLWMTYSSGVPTYTLAGHIVFKIMEEMKLKDLNPEELKTVDEWLSEHKSRYAPNMCEEPRKNLVLVICESLESWPIGLEIDGKEITPYLNSLVNDSTNFYAPNVLTQVCNGHSIDAQLIYTTGLLPTSNTVYSMKYADRNYPSLNKLLKKDRNTKSILMTTDKPTTWNMLAVERAFEYDTVLHRYNWVNDEIMNRNITDGSFFRQSLAQLKKGKLWTENSPAMLTFITFSGHHPFVMRDDLMDPDFNVANKGLPQMLENYIKVTHYVDSQLRTVIDYIKGRSDYDDTMIVILGDHEGLGTSRKEILGASDFAREHVGKGRYTPMIILNSAMRGKHEGIMGQVDVFPTLLDLLGVKEEVWRGLGVSLLDTSRLSVAFSEMPLEMAGSADSCSAEELEHLRSAQSVSEKIIAYDLYDSLPALKQ
ncbi:MAG: LTA synthase family protein [Muribaculaceae bacterium]|nr:LTA synthase family protein [Muribaculaceae bacterium]